MWIYEVGTLKFLEVNEAAINSYGYTWKEFLSMTLKDIRPTEEQERLMELQKSQIVQHPTHKGLWKHIKKDGEIL